MAAEPLDITEQIAAGGSVELPEGEFTVSRLVQPPKAKSLRLTGKGPTRTNVHVAEGAGIVLAGAPLPSGVIQNVAYWSIENLTLDGDGKAANALKLDCATQGLIHRVLFVDFKGHAILADQWWDSMVSAVDVVRCGDPEAKIPAVRLRNGDRDGGQVNNITWIGGRFESNPWVSLFIGADESEGVEFRKPRRRSRVNRFVSVKFHSTLPTSQKFDHVWLNSVDDCSFSGNFTHCGGSAFVLKDCIGNSFGEAFVGGCERWGFEFIGCPKFHPDDLQGVKFYSAGGGCRLGKVKVSE